MTARLVLAVGGHRWDPAIMVAIAGAESSWHSESVSPPNRDGSRDRGLFQINDHAHADLLRRFDWRDPRGNTEMAYIVWRPGNYHAWTTYFNGAYLRFLAVARNAVDQVERGGRPGTAPPPLPAGTPSPQIRGGAGVGRPTPTTPQQEGLPAIEHTDDYSSKVTETGQKHVGVYDLLAPWARHIAALGQR